VDIGGHIAGIGRKLVEGLRSLAAREGVSEFVRVAGFDANPQIVCTRANGEYWPELHTAFHEEVISHGVVIPWISITYSHGEEELARTFEAVGEGMRRVRRESEKASGPCFEGEAVKPVFRPFNRCRQALCGRLHPAAPQSDCCREEAESPS